MRGRDRRNIDLVLRGHQSQYHNCCVPVAFSCDTGVRQTYCTTRRACGVGVLVFSQLLCSTTGQARTDKQAALQGNYRRLYLCTGMCFASVTVRKVDVLLCPVLTPSALSPSLRLPDPRRQHQVSGQFQQPNLAPSANPALG